MTRTDPSMTVATAVEEAKQGADLMVKCAAHEDGTASLHISPSTSGVLLKCHAGCDTKDILDAVNLTWSDLFHEPTTRLTEPLWTPHGHASHVYPYVDERGLLLYEVLRVPQGKAKTFVQRRPTGDQVRPYEWRLGDVRRVLYRLPQTLAAVRNGDTVYVVEGEKDADTLVSHGLNATTNSGGAGRWLPEFSEALAGARVVIVQDADTVGQAHGRQVRESLMEHGCQVAIMEAPSPHKDVTSLLEHGGSMTELLTMVPFDDVERERFGVDVLDLILRDPVAIEYVVPGTLARRERLIVVGPEGQGKSTLLRQLAVKSAAGMHWWTDKEIDPVKVLVIDAENAPDQTLTSWQDLVGLAAHYKRPVERGQLIVLEEWDADIDLAGKDGTAWLHERIHGYQPDLCFLGPITNLVGRDTKDDEPVRRLKNAINSARTICGTSFVMEHHAPHKSPVDKIRTMRPYGSSMFLKWPDFGYGMQPHQNEEGTYWWRRWRWPRVRQRIWPEGIRWGIAAQGEFPWVECVPPAEVPVR